MDNPSDDHLQSFRLRSDQAFLAMQSSADKAMASFLQSYGEGAQMGSFQTPDFAWGRAHVPSLEGAAAPVRAKVRDTVDRGKQSLEKAAGKKRKRSGGEAHAAFNDFGELGEGLKHDFQEHVQEAATEGKGLLRSFTADLGERAKREAAALAEAARRAVAEESSLKGLKQRAQAELEAAKRRVAEELTDVKADALSELEGRAVQKIGQLHGEGLEVAEDAARLTQQRMNDILLGAPPDKP